MTPVQIVLGAMLLLFGIYDAVGDDRAERLQDWLLARSRMSVGETGSARRDAVDSIRRQVRPGAAVEFLVEVLTFMTLGLLAGALAAWLQPGPLKTVFAVICIACLLFCLFCLIIPLTVAAEIFPEVIYLVILGVFWVVPGSLLAFHRLGLMLGQKSLLKFGKYVITAALFAYSVLRGTDH